MEAATPLRNPSVRIVGDRVVVDGLVVADECAVRLVREGDDPVRVVEDAIEIGVRVLDREQTGANAEFVRSEFDKTAREVQTVFTDGARDMQQELERRLEEVFGPDGGALAKSLERYFSDDSSTAVQHRVREHVAEVMVKARDDMRKMFSSGEGTNPLADFKVHTLTALKGAAETQDRNLRAVHAQMAQLQKELQALRDEKQKLEELEAERERGTAKGRTFEELVAEAIDSIAAAQGDDCDAVGDLRGSEGRAGDVVVSIDACSGPARGRIVFEVKNSKLSKPKALSELEKGMRDRDADFAVLVVSAEEKVPARMRPLREYNGDKLIVAYDPDEDNGLTLEIAYSLARARVLMSRSESDGVDTAAVHDTVERALGALEDVKRVKSTLSGATTQIEKAREIVDEMAGRVREHLREIDELAAGDVEEADEAAEDPQQTLT